MMLALSIAIRTFLCAHLGHRPYATPRVVICRRCELLLDSGPATSEAGMSLRIYAHDGFTKAAALQRFAQEDVR